MDPRSSVTARTTGDTKLPRARATVFNIPVYTHSTQIEAADPGYSDDTELTTSPS